MFINSCATGTSTINVIGKDTSSPSIDHEASDHDYNKIQVMNCFASIENYLNELITHEIIGGYSPERAKQIAKFNSKILHTSWFNFNEKRKMVIEILSREEMSKTEKDNIDKSLRRIMSYRNSLAHGQFSTDGKTSKLDYYEGDAKEQILNDEYWLKVKTHFDYVFDLMLKVLEDKKIIK